MKIWITRGSASSIMFGGLERIYIWFRKPEYKVQLISEGYRDTPFGDLTIDQYPYYKKLGWEASHSNDMWTGSNATLSFGKIFGYSDGINSEFAKHVWAEVCNHFNNADFDTWEQLEKDGICKNEDFLLEIDFDIKINTTTNTK